MNRGDKVRDWQGAVEGLGVGRVEAIEGERATVRFGTVVADLPISHLEVVEQHSVKVDPNQHIVTFTNDEGFPTTFGMFTGAGDALAWIDGIRQNHPEAGGHFTIDIIAPPTTWDSKSCG